MFCLFCICWIPDQAFSTPSECPDIISSIVWILWVSGYQIKHCLLTPDKCLGIRPNIGHTLKVSGYWIMYCLLLLSVWIAGKDLFSPCKCLKSWWRIVYTLWASGKQNKISLNPQPYLFLWILVTFVIYSPVLSYNRCIPVQPSWYSCNQLSPTSGR